MREQSVEAAAAAERSASSYSLQRKESEARGSQIGLISVDDSSDVEEENQNGDVKTLKKSEHNEASGAEEEEKSEKDDQSEGKEEAKVQSRNERQQMQMDTPNTVSGVTPSASFIGPRLVYPRVDAHVILAHNLLLEMQDIYGLDDKESLDCTVCLSEPKDIIPLPCRHCCICHECFENIQGKCPVCRSHILSFMRFTGSSIIHARHERNLASNGGLPFTPPPPPGLPPAAAMALP